MIETVEEHCRHTDCVYRCILDAQGTPFCNYAVMERRMRNSRISECDKYKRGRKRVVMNAGTLNYTWELIE